MRHAAFKSRSSACPEGMKEYRCRFCQGSGTDPFGVMSTLSTCTACNGRTKFLLSESVKECAYCAGSGVNPRSGRYPCLACRGSGLFSMSAEPSRCSSCAGTGASPNRVWYCFCCHGSGIA